LRAAEGMIATVVVLLAPIGLLYGWFFYWTRMRYESRSWRNRIAVVSLVLVSLAVLSWPAMAMLAPKVDWVTYVGAQRQLDWVDAWEKVALRTLLGALVLGLFGRPRLILPIAVACVGTALFWIFSTMP
jgi:hypothetical protein